MNILDSLLLALGLAGSPESAPRLDIPYFKANPEIRAETLRRCHADYALARTPTCENAEAAGTLSLGRPLSSWPDEDLPLLSPPRKKAPPTVAKADERGA